MGDVVTETFEDHFHRLPLRRFVLDSTPEKLKATVHAAFTAAAADEFVGELVPVVNHDRWVVQCPCKGAQFASRVTPVFVCVDCGAGPFRVVWDG